MAERSISFDRMEQAVSLFGSFDENIKLIEQQYGVDIVNRGAELKISGSEESVDGAARAVNGLLTLINKGEALSEQNVRYVMSLVADGSEDKLASMSSDCICITSKGKPVKPKTLGQKKYTDNISKFLSFV